MLEEQAELLEEYIAGHDEIIKEDPELSALCDLVDEIRALHPVMPSDGFAVRLTDRLTQILSVGQTGRMFQYRLVKPFGWVSAIAAALMLILLGVLPTQPTEELPPAPVPFVQHGTQMPPGELNSAPLIKDQENKAGTEATKESAAPLTDRVSRRGAPSENSSGSVSENRLTASLQPRRDGKATDEKNDAEVGQEDMRTVYIPPLESFTDISSGKMPFRILTIPERSPVQVKTSDNPPEITMIYSVGEAEITVRQRVRDVTDTVGFQREEHVVRILRDNVAIEVRGNVDTGILEEFAQNLK